ncbi:MAG TPA: prolyl oligopeptidase family serine peptidase [Egibacteraceae bacterium]|nr:prolyl oligopeptidase family serine peptidase [Egibacteraceae bacterium]
MRELTDPDWVELVGGVPRWLPDGRLLHTVDEEDTRRLAADGVALTPPGLQVRRVAGVQDGHVVFTASREPTATELYRVALAGGDPEPLTAPGGMADGAVGGPSLVTVRRSLERSGPEVVVRRGGVARAVAGAALPHGLELHVRLLELGPRALRAALVLPAGHGPGDGPLPVLLDPYGGPHAQRVVQAADAYLTSQWFADQGFAVLVADGRGTPARGPAWEKAVAGDLASAPLEDQVDALHAAAEAVPGALDLSRVAIRGWSFGGFLAALAVLRRPDVFHAAIAGAPVTDWSLYDTHYTERYLGTPQDDAARYRRSSLLDDAAGLARPLLLIHGLADDNVVAAHTLRLSGALLAAGRPHEVLPLSGVTHMTPQEVVAENLLRLQLEFLRRHLERPRT